MDGTSTTATIITAVSYRNRRYLCPSGTSPLDRTKKTEITMRIYDRFGNKEIVEAVNKVAPPDLRLLRIIGRNTDLLKSPRSPSFLKGSASFWTQNLIDIKMNTRVSLLLGESLKSNGFLANTTCGALTWSLFRGGQTSKRV
jgi:hypothetical protein